MHRKNENGINQRLTLHHLPIIETQRLRLDDLTYHDETTIFELFSNPQVLQFYDLAAFVSVTEAKILIEKMHDRWERQIGFRYAIRDYYGRMLGTCGVNAIIPVENDFAAVIGYELHPDEWGKGYMQEALSGLIHHLRTELLFGHKIKYVGAEIFKQNLKSQQVVNKLGFEKVEYTKQNAHLTELLKFELKLY